MRTSNTSFLVLASQLLLVLISLSVLILASYSGPLLTRVSLAAVKTKEDGRHSDFNKIKDKNASRAGSERGYRNFLFHFRLSVFPQNSPNGISKGFKFQVIEKNKAQVLCDMFNLSMNITELKPYFNKLLTAIPCQEGYQHR